MLARNGSGLVLAATRDKARGSVDIGKCDGTSSPQNSPAQAIVAELIGDDGCIAEGIVCRGSAPILQACRLLLAAGHDPASPLHAVRRDTLCLVVRSIGEGATVEIAAHGVGFRPLPERGRRPPVSAKPPEVIEQAPTLVALTADRTADSPHDHDDTPPEAAIHGGAS